MSPSTTGANGIDRWAGAPQRCLLVDRGRHRVSGGGQSGGGDGRQVCHGGAQAEFGGAGSGDVGGKRRAEHALCHGSAEKAGRAWHREQCGDRASARRLAENRDSGRLDMPIA
jgi:hypothetical protein